MQVVAEPRKIRVRTVTWEDLGIEQLQTLLSAVPAAHRLPTLHLPISLLGGFSASVLSSLCLSRKACAGLGCWGGREGGERRLMNQTVLPHLQLAVSEPEQGAALYRDLWEPKRGLAMPWRRSRETSRRDWHFI